VKATLEFNLPDDAIDFEVAVRAMDYALAWNNLKEQLRQAVKYGTQSDEVKAALQELRAGMIEADIEDRFLQEL
jgi:hypothetical protein